MPWFEKLTEERSCFRLTETSDKDPNFSKNAAMRLIRQTAAGTPETRRPSGSAWTSWSAKHLPSVWVEQSAAPPELVWVALSVFVGSGTVCTDFSPNSFGSVWLPKSLQSAWRIGLLSFRLQPSSTIGVWVDSSTVATEIEVSSGAVSHNAVKNSGWNN